MSSLEQSDDLAEIVRRLEVAVRRRLGDGIAIKNVSVATLGGSSRTIIFDAIEGSTSRRLVSRQETYTLDQSPFLPPEKQYKLLQLAYKHGVPVPEPIFEFIEEDQLGRGHIMAHVDGETLPKKLLHDPQFETARDAFIEQAAKILVLIHSIDPREAKFLDDSLDTIDPLQAQMVPVLFAGGRRSPRRPNFGRRRRNGLAAFRHVHRPELKIGRIRPRPQKIFRQTAEPQNVEGKSRRRRRRFGSH
jgi:hypothetical protein